MSRMNIVKRWYFARVALMVVPWERRNEANPTGTLFKESYLIQAKDMLSARRKAERIMSVSESRTGSGEYKGKKVDFLKVGILDLEQITDKLISGAEIFEEHDSNISLKTAKALVVPKKELDELIRKECKKGPLTILDVYWGDDFESL